MARLKANLYAQFLRTCVRLSPITLMYDKLDVGKRSSRERFYAGFLAYDA